MKRVSLLAKPTTPFKEGTKKLLVAQKLITGEVDRGKVAREVGVSIHRIYTVASDLRAYGYTIIDDVKTPKSPPPPRVTSTPRVTQRSTRGEVAGRSVGEATPQSNSSGEAGSEEKYFSGDVPEGTDVPAESNRRVSRVIVIRYLYPLRT